MLGKSAWIIGGSGVVSVAAVAGLVYQLYVRSPELSGTGKTAGSDSSASKIAPKPIVKFPAGGKTEKEQTPQADKNAPQADKKVAGVTDQQTQKPVAATKRDTGKPDTGKPDASTSASQSAKGDPKTQPVGRSPSFDVVRVEPSGESVIAGRAEPGAEVVVLNKGKPFAKAKADNNGQFVVVAKPLKPGAHQLQLRSRSKNKTTNSDQAVAVSVPKPGGKEVIVALTEPDKPTVILSDSGKTPAASDKPETAGKQPGAGQKPDKKVAALPGAGTPAASGPAPVRIRIVEAEQKGGFFVSGRGGPGGRVRLYLNGSFIAEVQTGNKGNWSMRISRGMSAGKYTVRADQVEGDSGKVLSRAEVPFEYPVVVAAARPVKPAAKDTAATASPPSANASASASAVAKKPSADKPVAIAANNNKPGQSAEASGVAKTATSPVQPGANASRPAEKVAARKPADPASPAAPSSGPQSQSPATGAKPPERTARATAEKSNAAGSGAAQSGAAPSAAKKEVSQLAGRKPDGAPAPAATSSGKATPNGTAVASGNSAGESVSPSKSGVERKVAARQTGATPAARDAGTAAAQKPSTVKEPAAKSKVDSKASDVAKVVAKVAASGETGVKTSGKTGILKLPAPAPAAHIVIERLTTASVAKGDSLWRISRKMLGRGIRYTQIYAANTDQIRNPALIYPGQVIVVPLGKGTDTGKGKDAGNSAGTGDAAKPAAKP